MSYKVFSLSGGSEKVLIVLFEFCVVDFWVFFDDLFGNGGLWGLFFKQKITK